MINKVKSFDSLVHATVSGRWPAKDGVDASAETLVREMDATGVARACLVAVAGLSENDDVRQIAKTHPDRFVPIASVDPSRFDAEAKVASEVRALIEEGFAGIKLHPRMHHYDPTDPRAIAALRAAGDAGAPAFVCTLFRRRGLALRSAADIVDHIVNAAPQTTMILLHGGGTELLDLFELVRMHSTLRLDLSFTLLRYQGSSLDDDIRFVMRNLDQRVVVGSDYPDYVPSQAWPRFRELADGLPDDKISRIAGGNLAQLFPEGHSLR